MTEPASARVGSDRGRRPVADRGRVVDRSDLDRRDRGAVTAEVALALPAVVLVLAVLLVTASAAATQLRCADGARAGARVAALGVSDAEVAEVVRRVAGDATTVQVHRSPPWVEVHVTATVAGGWFSAGPLGLSATATAWTEP